MGESVTSQPTKGVGISSETPSPPAAASIYGIVRRHCRERLLVPPLLWTNRHLELLQMSFDEPTLAPETERLDYYSKRWSKPVGKRVLKSYLKRFDLLEYREKYIQALFYGWESPFTPDTASLPIGLDGFRVHATCQGIDLRKAGSDWAISPNYPICAYIDSGRIEEWRKNSLHIRWYSPQNPPVYAMLCQKLKSLRPINPLKEPYIAALLVALAHNRRRMLEAYEPEELSDLEIYPTQALYSLENQTSVYLYKADIPSLLLDMFEHPTIAPHRSPRISIQVFEIPCEPADTFSDRILALVFQTGILIRPSFEMVNGRKRKRN